MNMKKQHKAIDAIRNAGINLSIKQAEAIRRVIAEDYSEMYDSIGNNAVFLFEYDKTGEGDFDNLSEKPVGVWPYEIFEEKEPELSHHLSEESPSLKTTSPQTVKPIEGKVYVYRLLSSIPESYAFSLYKSMT